MRRLRAEDASLSPDSGNAFAARAEFGFGLSLCGDHTWKMSDRSKTSLPGPVVLASLVAGFFLSGCSDPYRTVAPLDVEAYQTSANSLRGNTCKLEGEVMSMLAWSPSGRLISIGIEGNQKAIPVLLPNEFNSVNIEKGRKFKFLLLVDDQGILRVKKLNRL